MRKLAVALLVLVSVESIAATRSNEVVHQRARVPMLLTDGDDGSSPLALAGLDIRFIVRGHLARATWELTYRNDLDRDVSGTLSFPLPTGAEVSDLGLYFDSQLRRAVAVERVQARAAFDQTVHRRVDPALAEWSSGRAFQLRVYPIPAHGTKTVHVAYDQECPSVPCALDLAFKENIAGWKLTVDAGDQRVETDGIAMTRDGSKWIATGQRTPLIGTVRIQSEGDDTAIAAWSREDAMWYASAPLAVRASTRSFPAASHVIVLWDSSASAVRADRARAVSFLEGLLSRQDANASATIVPFHIDFEPSLSADASEIEHVLERIEPAGATDLAGALQKLPSLLAAAPRDTRVVVMTDGVQMLGNAARMSAAIVTVKALRRPLAVMTATEGADERTLGLIAQASGGWYVDLTATTTEAAIDYVMHAPSGLRLRAATGSIGEVFPESLPPSAAAAVTINGRSRNRPLVWNVESGNTRHTLRVRDCDDCGDLVRRSWARAKLASLVASNAAAGELTAHGLRFQQVTPHTSLLILDSWRDYEMYGIPVPEELRLQKEADLKAEAIREREVTTPSSITLNRSTPEQPSRPATWFIKGRVTSDEMPLPGVTITLTTPEGLDHTTVSDVDGHFWIGLETAPASFDVRAELSGFSPVRRRYTGVPNRSEIEISMRVAAVSEAITVTAAAVGAPGDEVSAFTADAPLSLVAPSKIALADRLLQSLATSEQPVGDEAVSHRREVINGVLEKLGSLSSLSDLFRYYVAARSVLGGEKRFQARAAIAIHDADPRLGIRVATDLAEAYPDDAAVLRIVGRLVDGWGRPELARQFFERAIELAPRDPQGWRELLLLEARQENGKAFARLLREYQSTPHDPLQQFDSAFALELERARGTGSDPRIDPAAVLQIEITWDTNYSDVDLHVVEADGEEVSYSHQQSRTGGVLHGDITTGFGPETYTTANPPSGDYRVFLEYFAGDATELSAETLAHVIIWERGRRTDRLVVLESDKERAEVATLKVR